MAFFTFICFEINRRVVLKPSTREEKKMFTGAKTNIFLPHSSPRNRDAGVWRRDKVARVVQRAW